MWATGRAAGFEMEKGIVEIQAVSVIVTGIIGVFASGVVASAGIMGAADKSSVEEGETDGGVNFAASVALEPCASAGLVLESAGQTGCLHL